MTRAVQCAGLLMLLVLVGCASEEDYLEVMRAQRAAYKETADILETIQDEKTLDEAKKALDAKREKFDAIAQKAKSLPKPSAQVVERLKEQQTLMQDSIDRLRKEIGRVRTKVKGGEEFCKQFESSSPGLMSAVQQ
jgi:hypothetical protein